jgi:ABC-type antimicrobial peptide transport system permease subunit
MNLATARAGTRTKEIGLRKVVGANKSNIVRQFLSESVVLAFFALLISLFIVALFLPSFNQLAGKDLNMNFMENPFLFLSILGITLLTGILAGSYPALFLSTFEPNRILKSTFSTKKNGKRNTLIRKGLVVFQFVLTIVLLISTTTVYRQMKFIKNQRMGFDENFLIYTQLRTEGNLWDRYDAQKIWTKYETLKNDLIQNSNILEVSTATCLPFGTMGNEFGQLDWEGKDTEFQVSMNHMAVDSNFLSTFQLDLVKGRFFSDEFSSDDQNFILNEAAVKAAGLVSPLGKRFRLLDKEGTIVGVIKDFHFAPLQTEIEPLVIHQMPYQYWMYQNYVFVRISSENVPRTLASLKKIWDIAIPDYPFEFNFLDTTIDAQYKSEQRLELILRIFTLMAIAISCFGLFGLISFTTEQKTKEIGIRRILGASVGSVVKLLTKEFIILVMIANFVAWPTAYFVMTKWLKNFAYRTEIGIAAFLLSGFGALVIAVLTVCFQSTKAALSNPVDSLRSE